MEYSAQEVITRLNAAREGTALAALDITLISVSDERVVATMPVGPNQRQLVGFLHGGVSVVLAETVASVGSILHIDTERQLAFGLEINANHVRPKKDGLLIATATPIHLGHTTHIWDIKIADEHDKLICISRCTVAIVDRPPDEVDLLYKDLSS